MGFGVTPACSKERGMPDITEEEQIREEKTVNRDTKVNLGYFNVTHLCDIHRGMERRNLLKSKR